MGIEEKAYELFFGVISPVGVDKSKTVQALKTELERMKYDVYIIKLSDLIQKIAPINSNITCEAGRVNALMDAGNNFRSKCKQGDAVALLGVVNIRQIRKDYNINENRKYLQTKNAYIFDSLKHEDELESLRKIYKDRFYAISIYASVPKRQEKLTQYIKKSNKSLTPQNINEISKQANKLINRDKSEPDNAYGQNIRKLFSLADLFVTEQDSKKQVTRFIRLLFGARFYTPTLDEFGMFTASSTALLSADLSRQVGAVILSNNGEVIATGWNEVPLPNGDFFWPSKTPNNLDFREYKTGTDTNSDKKHYIIDELLTRLKENNWLNPNIESENNNDLIHKCLYEGEKLLKGTRLASLIEFGRITHAEMSAITTAARLGVSTKDSILYCTTFPCHGCAKHIISAGIKEVHYIEPYPKSMTDDLYREMVCIDNDNKSVQHNNPVQFKPYIGISPKNYHFLFTALERKHPDGTAYTKEYLDLLPRIQHVNTDYDDWETVFTKKILDNLGDKSKG